MPHVPIAKLAKHVQLIMSSKIPLVFLVQSENIMRVEVVLIALNLVQNV